MISKSVCLVLAVICVASTANADEDGAFCAETRPQNLRPSDTFAALKLKKAEINQLLPALERLAYDTPDSWRSELIGKRTGLGKTQGIILRGTNLLCGGTGNCQVFVFRRVNGGWVSLFEDQAPIVEAFEFGPTSSRGIKDFIVITNSNSNADRRVTYKFDGSGID